MRSLGPLALLLSFVICATAAPYHELTAWANRDCDDYRTLVAHTNAARSGHDVAAAMRENVRRQNETIKILLQFARSHPDLRDAAQLGLDKDGQVFWREHYPNRTMLPAEVNSIQQHLTSCMDAVSAGAQNQMVNVLRKYNQDKEVVAASRELHKMWSEHDVKLLEAMR